VDHFVLHGEPVGFRALCEQVLTPRTRYLVLDLDRTVHLGRNIGELLGWELQAWAAYGESFLEGARSRRGPGRFVFDWSRPAAVARYLVGGARAWAYPGTLYLGAVKIGARVPLVRRWSYRRFGVDPVEAVQAIPRTALLHQLAHVPVETLRALVAEIWARCAGDQVISREDIAWLRERFPDMRVVISSASPQPVLEVAARELGVHEVLWWAIEEHDGYLSAPFVLHRLFLLPRAPRRIAPPSGTKPNAGPAKIQRLLERFPDFFDHGVETVGITDTSHGEDHSWAHYFTKVVDINSPAPFSPIVPAGSPVTEIHSAQVMTRSEAERRGRGDRTWLDPRRKGAHLGTTRRLESVDLAAMLAGALEQAESLAKAYERETSALSEAARELETLGADVLAAIERSVLDYNRSTGTERRRALRRLRRQLRERASLQRRLARAQRPAAMVAHALATALGRARGMVAQAGSPPQG
jgi:hypothetical protein